MRYNIFLLSLLAIFLISCEELIIGEDLESTNARENFEYLWKECQERYTYFDLKNINWDNVYSEYEPRISDNMSEVDLFRVLGDMLNELKDGHVNLRSNFNRSFFPIPQLGVDNFDFRIIQDNYLPSAYFVSGPFQHDFIADGEVGYVRFGAFTGQIDDTNIGFIIDRYKNTKGLILDLRENGGGAVTDVFALLERFINTETVVFRSRVKKSAAPNDFSDLEEAVVEPYDGDRYTKKVMVLVDRGTYSAGSFLALSTKAIPTMMLVGDYTGGGLGAPNGGQLPNGWTYRFSITQSLDLDGNDYENGVPPDIEAFLDWEDRTTDEVIERALLELL